MAGKTRDAEDPGSVSRPEPWTETSPPGQYKHLRLSRSQRAPDSSLCHVLCHLPHPPQGLRPETWESFMTPAAPIPSPLHPVSFHCVPDIFPLCPSYIIFPALTVTALPFTHHHENKPQIPHHGLLPPKRFLPLPTLLPHWPSLSSHPSAPHAPSQSVSSQCPQPFRPRACCPPAWLALHL